MNSTALSTLPSRQFSSISQFCQILLFIGLETRLLEWGLVYLRRGFRLQEFREYSASLYQEVPSWRLSYSLPTPHLRFRLSLIYPLRCLKNSTARKRFLAKASVL